MGALWKVGLSFSLIVVGTKWFRIKRDIDSPLTSDRDWVQNGTRHVEQPLDGKTGVQVHSRLKNTTGKRWTQCHRRITMYLPSGAVGLSVAQNTNSLDVVVVHRGYPATLVTDQHVADFRVEFRKKLCRLPTTSWPRFDSNFIEWHTLHFVPTCTWVSPHKDTHNGAAMLRDRGKNRRSWTTAYAQGYSQHTEPPSGNEGFTYQNQKLVHRPAYGQNLRTNLGTKSKEFVIKSTGDQIWIYGTPHLYPDSFTP